MNDNIQQQRIEAIKRLGGDVRSVKGKVYKKTACELLNCSSKELASHNLTIEEVSNPHYRSGSTSYLYCPIELEKIKDKVKQKKLQPNRQIKIEQYNEKISKKGEQIKAEKIFVSRRKNWLCFDYYWKSNLVLFVGIICEINFQNKNRKNGLFILRYKGKDDFSNQYLLFQKFPPREKFNIDKPDLVVDQVALPKEVENNCATFEIINGVKVFK